ncbi:MAG: hypothetical protein ABI442_07905 [Gemmatimonadaceae bacterium]
MSRNITLLCLVAATVSIAACADVTAPTTTRALSPANVRRDWDCLSGYESSTGFVCTDSSAT